jgi:hypothetical protein
MQQTFARHESPWALGGCWVYTLGKASSRGPEGVEDRNGQ